MNVLRRVACRRPNKPNVRRSVAFCGSSKSQLLFAVRGISRTLDNANGLALALRHLMDSGRSLPAFLAQRGHLAGEMVVAGAQSRARDRIPGAGAARKLHAERFQDKAVKLLALEEPVAVPVAELYPNRGGDIAQWLASDLLSHAVEIGQHPSRRHLAAELTTQAIHEPWREWVAVPLMAIAGFLDGASCDRRKGQSK